VARKSAASPAARGKPPLYQGPSCNSGHRAPRRMGPLLSSGVLSHAADRSHIHLESVASVPLRLSDLQNGAVRHETGLEIAPECDQQLACYCDDRNSPDTALELANWAASNRNAWATSSESARDWLDFAHALQYALRHLEDAFARLLSGLNRFPNPRKKFQGRFLHAAGRGCRVQAPEQEPRRHQASQDRLGAFARLPPAW
jgi:hypothetical protein